MVTITFRCRFVFKCYARQQFFYLNGSMVFSFLFNYVNALQELRVDEIIAKLSDYRSPMEAERCSDTLKNVIANAIDTETNKIVELIEIVARKMSPPMRRFLTEGAELLHQDSNSMDRIMMYLEESLQTLNAELNEVNFERILDAIWTELAFILKELVQNNIDVSFE